MCRAHGIGFDMKVITCCARVSSSFDHVSFAMQYAVQCSVCLRTFRWDFVLFCFVFFSKSPVSKYYVDQDFKRFTRRG